MSGKPYCMFNSAYLSGNVLIKRKQLESYSNIKGLEISKLFIIGKLNNQANLLKYFNKYNKRSNDNIFEEISKIISYIEKDKELVSLITGNSINEKRSEILLLEANAGKNYWKAVSTLLKISDFKREHRGTEDVTNSLFNYGYGILYSKVWGAVLNAGLEPFAGFLHVDRINKPSMILDFVEEFRQPIVDKTIIAMLNKGTKFKVVNGLLDPESREKLAEKILERLEDRVTLQGKEFALKSVIQIQARNISSFFVDNKKYKSYSFKW